MLGDKELKAFIPTVDADRAKRFYQEVLGLTLLSEDNYALEFNANGTLLRIIIVPELRPQNFTVLGWNVSEISLTIQSLADKGVVFEKYSFLRQNDLGIWVSPSGTQIAWFKDPDGNVLSLSE